jgi:itaconate CoA-transferase
MTTNLPLEGITIISCEQAVAAPFATRQLADMGANVIKVERPGTGDFARDYDETVNGLSSHFVWLNRSKESLTLDLKQPEAREVMHKLLADADVFVQNFAPGAAERLGFGAEELRRDYPRLITCSISGYGSSGPYRDAKAYDLLIQSEAGLVSITGTDGDPAKSGIPAADIAAGMYAFSGILSALYNRERTGEGSALEISLFDSLIEWMGYPMYYTEYGGTAPARAGTSHAAIAPYGTYSAGDGVDIVLSIQNEREWTSFCETVLLQPELATDPRFNTGSKRVENRNELNQAINAVFSASTGIEMQRRLDQAKVANARQREVADVLDHPQLAARNRWQKVDTPAGPVRAVLPAITTVGNAPRMDPVPDIGEHSVQILARLGYAPEDIDAFRSKRVF